MYAFCKFVEDIEEDCGISLQRELEEMERVLQDENSCVDLNGK